MSCIQYSQEKVLTDQENGHKVVILEESFENVQFSIQSATVDLVDYIGASRMEDISCPATTSFLSCATKHRTQLTNLTKHKYIKNQRLFLQMPIIIPRNPQNPIPSEM